MCIRDSIDPVLVNHRGEAMFPPAVAAAYRALLFPLADLVTPNRAEARLLGMLDEAQGRTPSPFGRGLGLSLIHIYSQRIMCKLCVAYTRKCGKGLTQPSI